ncbi:hypothetical protein ACT17_15070 [Mycolicibacterium conceptionense]|uniref:DUF1508 domain-containing protein n=1 Tax=Mycolicibacterium conceptionense TaxID=451644 RepID=A0A0J8U7V2_9MYCO|nr:hypothetical protein [Mycolicibacterium conceptionense]KMV17603.1 hypothetical protein ACT17_15070 [Mycolicibacterium conceptionense]
MSTWPGWGGWHVEMQGDCEYHVATVAGGHRAAYVTLNDADEWIAGVYDRQGNPTVIGSGYSSLHEAKLAADEARNA